MGKPLFENVGGEMKAYAEAIARSIQIKYGLAAVASVVVCFGLDARLGLIALLPAVILFWHGYQQSKLTAMQLYAYGELVERVASIDHKLGGNKQAGQVKPKTVSVSKKSEVPISARKSDGSWVCPFCDHHNPAGADWCEDCGVAAEFE